MVVETWLFRRVSEFLVLFLLRGMTKCNLTKSEQQLQNPYSTDLHKPSRGTSMSAAAPGTTFIILMLPFLAALIAPWLTRRLGHNAAWLLALAPLAIFIHFLGLLR
jgi:hypothetical protein